MPQSTLFDLGTPSLILNRTRLRRNIERMSAACARNKVSLRPHMKTAKSIDVARLVLQNQDQRIAVSTLKEAEYFAAHGIKDIQYAVTVLPNKLARVAEIQKSGATVTLATDNAAMTQTLADKAAELGAHFQLQVEIDSGENRAGIYPQDPQLSTIGQIIEASPYLTFAGILGHAGHSYKCTSVSEIRHVAELERRTAVKAAEHIRKMGITCPSVSIGSTPTALHAAHLDGITEVRTGVYQFGDMYQAQIGTCTVDDLAVSVLTEVTGQRPELKRLLVDAGALALSKDRSTQSAPKDIGFGLLGDVNGHVISPELHISKVFQEHGVVEVSDPSALDKFPLCSRLRIFPNHICLTAAAFDRYYVVDDEIGDGTEIVAEWPRVNGW